MDLTIQQLRMLREVAVVGTIGAAAKSLGYTASAVSQQLGGLERMTGVAVLERIGRNVQLTDAGRELVTHAEAVLARIEEASAALERVSSEVSGVLRVGVMETVSNALLPRLLEVLAERHPQLQLRTIDLYPSDPLQLVRSGTLDAAFAVGLTFDGVPSLGLSSMMICQDWFRAVVPADYEHQDEEFDIVRLEGEALIAAPALVACGRPVLQACRDAGFEPDIVHELDNYRSTLQLVAAGAGFALVPDLGLLDPPEGIVVLDLEKPFCRSVEFAYRSSSEQRPALQALMTAIGDIADEFGLDRGV